MVAFRRTSRPTFDLSQGCNCAISVTAACLMSAKTKVLKQGAVQIALEASSSRAWTSDYIANSKELLLVVGAAASCIHIRVCESTTPCWEAWQNTSS